MSNALVETSYKLQSGQTLNSETVKNYLVSGNGSVTDQEVMMFIELCKAQKLNPFIREAYLIKFGSSPANIVVGKDVFVKRAYRNPSYEGMKAGIVVIKENGEIEEREGSLKLPKETLVGGWCEVYVKEHKYPVKSTVSVEEYSKSQSTWKSMPCVMIRKCALVTALREAFPEDLQGLYDSAEIKDVPDKLPEKEVEIGKASLQQKNAIMKVAELCGIYDFADKKNTKELESFCSSKGYGLHNLTYDEADEVIKLISEYADEIRKKEQEVVDVEFEDVGEGQQTMDV
ncbi:phage recombination protein Bet [Peptostreptococcus faecalis]|uniref:phage recombination protein Bet n=1 Tax=Peptostreptococcus faecalis TaxID=2045015 RepID=UPI000C7E3CAB|nr:phage recombination protein Bet [Peptostreptococcus faecalis]